HSPSRPPHLRSGERGARVAHQSDPSTLPSAGVQAFCQVAADTSEPIVRTLASPRAITMTLCGVTIENGWQKPARGWIWNGRPPCVKSWFWLRTPREFRCVTFEPRTPPTLVALPLIA